MSTSHMRCVVVTWGDAYRMSRKMALAAKASKFIPDVVVGISRGGVVPARIACDILGVSDLLTVKIEHWLQTGAHTEHAVIKHALSTQLDGKKVLVVDDIADTGESLKEAVAHCASRGSATVKSAVMQKLSGSRFEPDFVGEAVVDWAWFIYPWNFYEDLTNLTRKLLESQPSHSWTLVDVQKAFKREYGARVSKKKLREVVLNLNEKGVVSMDGPVFHATSK
ncbi:MAG: phosphoribosyltransferase [Thermoprotei archaeon]